MINFICCAGFVGCFFLLLAVGYLAFILFLYGVYKIDGGKLNIFEYFKRMI